MQCIATSVVLQHPPLIAAAHFPRIVEEVFVYLGARIGYWQGSIGELMDDVGALKPTIFAGVPRVFDRIRSRILERVRGPLSLRIVQYSCTQA